MTSSFFFSQEGVTVGEQDLSSALNREETLPALELTTSSTKKMKWQILLLADRTAQRSKYRII